MKNWKTIFAVVCGLAVSACGGGGGGTTAAPAPVASTSTFNLLAASKSQVSTPNSSNFSVGGTLSGFAVTGSGTETNGAVTAGTFEGVSALQQTTTVTGTATGNGTSFPLASSSISWTDSNYIPLGESGGSEYIVIKGTPTIPTAARVNDTGGIYTANRYTSSTKTSLIGTLVVTYVVEADTASTALVTILSAYKNTLGATTKTGTSQLRVTTSNTFARVKVTAVDPANSISLTITY